MPSTQSEKKASCFLHIRVYLQRVKKSRHYHRNYRKLFSLTNNNKIENKCANGRSSYFAKASFLPTATDESLLLPVNCETLSVKNKEKFVKQV